MINLVRIILRLCWPSAILPFLLSPGIFLRIQKIQSCMQQLIIPDHQFFTPWTIPTIADFHFPTTLQISCASVLTEKSNLLCHQAQAQDWTMKCWAKEIHQASSTHNYHIPSASLPLGMATWVSPWLEAELTRAAFCCSMKPCSILHLAGHWWGWKGPLQLIQPPDSHREAKKLLCVMSHLHPSFQTKLTWVKMANINALFCGTQHPWPELGLFTLIPQVSYCLKAWAKQLEQSHPKHWMFLLQSAVLFMAIVAKWLQLGSNAAVLPAQTVLSLWM